MDGKTRVCIQRIDRDEACSTSQKRNLSDLINWRGINLLDSGSKSMIIILNIRAQKLLQNDRIPMQFGATPNMDCADAVFSLKSGL